jgi:hypothetical protein
MKSNERTRVIITNKIALTIIDGDTFLCIGFANDILYTDGIG